MVESLYPGLEMVELIHVKQNVRPKLKRLFSASNCASVRWSTYNVELLCTLTHTGNAAHAPPRHPVVVADARAEPVATTRGKVRAAFRRPTEHN